MYDGLYQTRTGTKNWLDSVSTECREWIEGLADHVAEHGEPVWRQVHAKLRELFPEDAPDSETTPKETIRRLVQRRG